MSYPPSRVVETAYGKVQGRRLIHEGEKKVDAFQGIPFAAPPVGELRFKKPVPPAKWAGVKTTAQFGPRAIQHPMGPGDYEMKGVPSEDSLYLNVFTPCWEAPEGVFPVMVFIHGGAFENGEASGYGDIGICENVVSRGIVFVTVQYRLGYLGFLSTGDSVCPGNFGLWDQVESLKWVQQNIEAFGGNKKNVTVLGQSAGAASVDLLHLSPHSTNLFHKGILMAGTAECRWATRKEMATQTLNKAGRLNVGEYNGSEELLAKLRELPAAEFGCGIFSQVKQDNVDFEAGPCMDGDFFPESLDVLRKKAIPKPFLTGVTKEEGLLMMPGRQSTPAGLEETLTDVTRDCTKIEEMKAELRTRFIGDVKAEDAAYMRAQAGMVSDAMFCVGTIELCKRTLALQAEPVFLYVFSHFHPKIMGFLAGMMPIQDVTHTCELFYLFKKGMFGDIELTETEKRVMGIYTTACTNFAAFGNPNGTGKTSALPINWEPITREVPTLNYEITSGETRMNKELFEGRTSAFIDIRNKYK